MARTVTWIVVGAVGVLGSLAVADSFRSEPSPRAAAPSPTTTRPKPPTLAETLRAETVTGFVVYSDRDCVLHSLRLPLMVDDLIRDDGGEPVRFCRFDVVGGRVAAEGHDADTSGLAVRRDGIHEGGKPILTRENLVAAARKHPNLAFQGYDQRSPLHVHVTGLARFSEREVIVAVAIRAHFVGRQFLAGIFRDRALVGIGASFRGPYRHLFVSSDGSLVGAEDGTVFMPDGRTIDPPQGLPVGRAVAFSPDNRWLARVNGISIFLIATPLNEELTRIIRLPVPARDLVWQPITSGTSVGPPIRR